MPFDFSSKLALEDSMVLLEPLSWSHFEDLQLICLTQPDLLRYSATPFGTTESLENYLRLAFEHKENSYRYPFAIIYKKEERCVGTTSFSELSAYDKRVNIGWTWISREYQRSGINRHSKFLMLAHAFETMVMMRVAFRADARNDQSRKALESLGATFEGEFRSHTLMSDGYRRNTVNYSILWEEWVEIKAAHFARQMNNLGEGLSEGLEEAPL